MGGLEKVTLKSVKSEDLLFFGQGGLRYDHNMMHEKIDMIMSQTNEVIRIKL